MKRNSFRVFSGDAQRLQKANVLRRHSQLGNGSAFEVGLIERILIDLNTERFQEAAIKRGKFRILIPGSIATRKTDGGIELQHDVISMRANACDGAGDAVGIRNRIVDSVSQLTEKVFKVIVKLQGSLSPTTM